MGGHLKVCYSEDSEKNILRREIHSTIIMVKYFARAFLRIHLEKSRRLFFHNNKDERSYEMTFM